ncbi:MAG TPA: dTDP-glucose 4,6-dehydratase [Sulfurospirillum sp. UBA12182]|nr:MAG TPA: dTDP-glucose 4,6-dehydratase [Sulfurospirillum sp. UBA12182]
MNLFLDKRILNILVIIGLSFITFIWTFWIFHQPIRYDAILVVIFLRIIASVLIFKDYSLSWSKASQKTFILKSFVYIVPLCIYMPFYHGQLRIAFMLSELFLYLFSINFLMYAYYLFINRSRIKKGKSLIIYGAGKAGLKLEEEYRNTQYKLKYFVDDDKSLQKRSIDGIKIISRTKLKELAKNEKFDLLVIAMPSAEAKRIKDIYERLHNYFREIRILPKLEQILSDKPFFTQLKNISLEDLLARNPKDLDKNLIKGFLQNKVVLVTGAGGSIGSEICRQCLKYDVKTLIALDSSEYNLYALNEELNSSKVISVLQNVLHVKELETTFEQYKPDIVIHAAAYKHVPLVEANIEEGIRNNILGTKNCIDLAIQYNVSKFILISTDKAVRPTNVMGTTKRICELYAANVASQSTDIVAVRFGNVLGSSGSVIPKFRSQIERGGPITVTHPEITRYFMLIPEACELVLQTGAIAKGGEICILDMGEPVKIADLAKRMCELSGREDIEIVFTGLRPGEKLYEELLLDESDKKTDFESITIAKNTPYEIQKLNQDIHELLETEDKLAKLKEIVPEFDHRPHC